MNKSKIFFTIFVIALLVISIKGETLTNAIEQIDIVTLIETATTSEDHIKIAEYYEEQATIMGNKAIQHESMAQAYKGTKFTGMTRHCQKLVKEFKTTAEQYKAMAAEHEKMAQDIQSQNSAKPQ